MSFSFTISPSSEVGFSSLVAALQSEFGSILTWEDEPPSPWPIDYYTHVFLWGVSTRSVELAQVEDGFQVRIMSCSCAQDYELALRTVEIVAQATGGMIEAEFGNEVTVETLREEFGRDWVNSMVTSGASFLPRLVASESMKGPLTLPGPVRDFVFGPRVIAELAGPEETFAERLFEKIRQVRYFDDEEYYQAKKMKVTPNDGKPVDVAIWGEGVTYLLPNVKLLVLMADDAPIFVPAEAIWELAGDACRALDDAQVLVEAIEGDEWLAVIERALKLAVVP